MKISKLIEKLEDIRAERGDGIVVLNEEDGWAVGDVELGTDDNGDEIVVIYDVAH